jgi:hypothetical protein
VSFKVLGAKLERGTQQTLARQDASGNWVLNEIPDYGEELRKCQRYALKVGYTMVSGVLTANRGELIFAIPTPETFIDRPTLVAISVTGVRTSNGAYVTPEVTQFTANTATSNSVLVTIKTQSFNVDPYVNNTPIACYIDGVLLDADL